MLIFWKAFVCRKYRVKHLKCRILCLYYALKGSILMQSVPFLRFGIIGIEDFIILYVIDLLIIR